MKILKYNLLLLEKQKTIYKLICFFIMFSLIDVLLIFIKQNSQMAFIEQSKTAEYLFLLNDPFDRIAPFLIFGFPVLFTLLIVDSTWIELKQGNCAFLYTRLDYFKNIVIRYFLSIVIVFLLSCFCFFLNYLSLSVIFGNGDTLTQFENFAFMQEIAPGFFLDTVRNSNPVLYSILLILHISILYGLLSGISYSLSFLFKNRSLIYVSSIIFIMLFEFLVIVLKVRPLSLILQLQPFSVFRVEEALILYVFLFLFGISTLCVFLFKKKDLLL